MDHKELTVSQVETEEMVPSTQGPVELDPSLFSFVSGGAPFATWGSTTTAPSNSTTSA